MENNTFNDQGKEEQEKQSLTERLLSEAINEVKEALKKIEKLYQKEKDRRNEAKKEKEKEEKEKKDEEKSHAEELAINIINQTKEKNDEEKSDAMVLAINMINRLKFILEDDNGKFFFGGGIMNKIECDENKEILMDNEVRLRKTFKNHTNWSNMRNSKKPVANHLRFIFCKLLNIKKYNGKQVRYGNYTCKKYYIPDCIASNIIIKHNN